jgi:hypothetical protein
MLPRILLRRLEVTHQVLAQARPAMAPSLGQQAGVLDEHRMPGVAVAAVLADQAPAQELANGSVEAVIGRRRLHPQPLRTHPAGCADDEVVEHSAGRVGQGVERALVCRAQLGVVTAEEGARLVMTLPQTPFEFETVMRSRPPVQ